MKITGNTILITGGATGIGFALAKAFLEAGNEIIICGRREHKLLEAQNELPEVHIRVCDVAKESDRRELFGWTMANFKKLNMLVNNAGIQREVDFRQGVKGLSVESELDINLAAPIHLSALFIPHLMAQPEAAIVNISSGLGFIPLAIMPVYCATKAGLHMFSVTLRHQLRDTSIRVYEVIPPTVDTELDRGARDRRGQQDRGIPPEEVASAALNGIQNDEFEKPVGMAQRLWQGARSEPEKVFNMINH
jgi:uncharacterized oxidoreductase